VNWLAEHAPIISALDGVVELVIAVVILLGVRARMPKVTPLAWLVVSYFAVESLISFNRVFVHVDREGTFSRIAILETVGTVIIVLLLANAIRIASATTTPKSCATASLTH